MTTATVTDRDRAVWRSLALMGRRLALAAEQRLQAEAGVSAPDFEILQALAAAPEHRARPVELGEMLSWEKSRISHHVTRMENRGLVERVECETDQRGTWVGITGAGRDALRQAVPVYEDVIRASLVDHLDREQVDALTAAALAVVRASEPEACAAELDSLEAPGGADRPYPTARVGVLSRKMTWPSTVRHSSATCRGLARDRSPRGRPLDGDMDGGERGDWTSRKTTMSSNPATATSSGTRRPAARRADMAPIAITSLTANTHPGNVPVLIMRFAASYPPSREKSARKIRSACRSKPFSLSPVRNPSTRSVDVPYDGGDAITAKSR